MCRRQRKIGHIGQQQIRLQCAQRLRLLLHAHLPVRMPRKVGRMTFGNLHLHGTDHLHAKIQFDRDMLELALKALRQQRGRCGGAQRDFQTRKTLRQRIHHRRRLTDMTVAMRRNIDQQMRHRAPLRA